MLSTPEQYTIDQWMGCSSDHVLSGRLSHVVHPAIVDDFLGLQSAAADEDIDLQIASSFRDFDRQLGIWNAKAAGERSLLDDAGNALNFGDLDDWQRVQAILRWSALPGSSRHHWGCDLDIYDAAAMPEGYQLQLTPQEYASDGLFSRLVNWLPDALPRFGFYRPYAQDKGGTAPEAWHISHRSTAEAILMSVSAADLRQSLRTRTDMLLVDTVLAHWDDIERRYLQPAWQ